ncbi:hypothetical protein BCR44DRAFT_1508922 [Catenaria anguillulae PL171]|uniref:ATP synthase subunit e, mitochondrial n=1 Tax=Catenaria anguillulae PL171 TaxID=765915 RepID=A0A1Y2I639_9FUNG|nr:hypothetical protein BCR44DRAFT_1508922 [Catenaria anguillulae PL171]
MSAAAAAPAVSATSSQAFRSWLLWGSAGVGLAYGLVRDLKLSRAAAIKRAEEAKRNPVALSGVVTDPDSPAFDLEKVINYWASSEDKKH